MKEESIRTMGSVVNDRCVGERGERGRQIGEREREGIKPNSALGGQAAYAQEL